MSWICRYCGKDTKCVDMDYLMKSKVIHFIGHEKPQAMMDIIDDNIKNKQ